MEYSINRLSKISGVSSRTLRHYDEIGLLKPLRINSSKYRIYGPRELDKLQQILFYKELGLPLVNIKEIVNDEKFDSRKAMEEHLTTLKDKKEQIEVLIENVKKTILEMNGEIIMSDNEKFQGFKKKMIEENEEKYGEEIREQYGEEVVEASNSKLNRMTPEEFSAMEKLALDLNESLKQAVATGDPAGEMARQTCELHRKWLTYFWPEGTYTKEAHKTLAVMYCADERFKEYYENIAPGCAEFLKEAIDIYCKE